MILTTFHLNQLAQATEESGNMFDIPTLLMLGGIMLLIAIMLLNMRRRYKNVGDSGGAAGRLERMEMNAGMKKDMSGMMVELEELSRQMSAQLDSKSMRLEKQMAEAEQLIAVLRETLAQANTGPTATMQQQDTRMNATTENYVSSRDAQTEFSNEPVFKPTPQPTYVEPGSDDPKQERIIELARQGKNAVQIARELDEQIGKVELILALRKN